MTIAWELSVAPCGGVWAALVTRREGLRREVKGCATADTLEKACEMGAELFRGCLEWPTDTTEEISASLEKPEVSLVPGSPKEVDEQD